MEDSVKPSDGDSSKTLLNGHNLDIALVTQVARQQTNIPRATQDRPPFTHENTVDLEPRTRQNIEGSARLLQHGLDRGNVIYGKIYRKTSVLVVK